MLKGYIELVLFVIFNDHYVHFDTFKIGNKNTIITWTALAHAVVTEAEEKTCVRLH